MSNQRVCRPTSERIVKQIEDVRTADPTKNHLISFAF
jgi:hypothetical protein